MTENLKTKTEEKVLNLPENQENSIFAEIFSGNAKSKVHGFSIMMRAIGFVVVVFNCFIIVNLIFTDRYKVIIDGVGLSGNITLCGFIGLQIFMLVAVFKVNPNVLATFVCNSLLSYSGWYVSKSLFSSANDDGIITKSSWFSVYKNFTFEEKLEWIKRLETQYSSLNLKNLANMTELQKYNSFTQLENYAKEVIEKQKVIKNVNETTSGVFSTIGNWASDHKIAILVVGAVIISAAVTYYFYTGFAVRTLRNELQNNTEATQDVVNNIGNINDNNAINHDSIKTLKSVCTNLQTISKDLEDRISNIEQTIAAPAPAPVPAPAVANNVSEVINSEIQSLRESLKTLLNNQTLLENQTGIIRDSVNTSRETVSDYISKATQAETKFTTYMEKVGEIQAQTTELVKLLKNAENPTGDTLLMALEAQKQVENYKNTINTLITSSETVCSLLLDDKAKQLEEATKVANSIAKRFEILDQDLRHIIAQIFSRIKKLEETTNNLSAVDILKDFLIK